MEGYRIGNGFIDFAKIDFACPYCRKEYDDADEVYSNRCNKNKCGYTKIKCSCGKKFGMTYDYRSDAVAFPLEPIIKERKGMNDYKPYRRRYTKPQKDKKKIK